MYMLSTLNVDGKLKLSSLDMRFPLKHLFLFSSSSKKSGGDGGHWSRMLRENTFRFLSSHMGLCLVKGLGKKPSSLPRSIIALNFLQLTNIQTMIFSCDVILSCCGSFFNFLSKLAIALPISQ